jgi:hypothetical protein
MTILTIVIHFHIPNTGAVFKDLATGPYLGPAESDMHTHCFRHFLKLFSHVCISLSYDVFLSRFFIKSVEHTIFCCNFLGMFIFTD